MNLIPMLLARPALLSPAFFAQILLATLFIVMGLPQHAVAENNAVKLMQLSQNGKYRITLTPLSSRQTLRKIHQWQVSIETVDGKAVTNARFEFDGRMPAHRHGLPTQPAFEGHQGDGHYLVGGVRFSMTGEWEIKIDGTVDGDSLYALFEFTL